MNDTPTTGHNMPPADANPIRDRLEEDYVSLTDRHAELLAGIERAPETVDDAETNGKMIDFVKQLKLTAKQAEGYRDDEKKPYLEGGRTVDAWFKAKQATLLDGAKKLEGRITVWQRKVAEEERKARAETERLAREEQERLEREAAEAAESATTDESLDNAIAAEEAAEQAKTDTASAEKASNAKSTDLSRAKTDSGTSASLRTFWDYRSLDMANVDLEALRPFINQDTIEKAVKAAIRSGARDIKGVDIFENTESKVR